jgi:hypothetical protein
MAGRTTGFQDLPELHCPQRAGSLNLAISGTYLPCGMERAKGLEPSTFSLGSCGAADVGQSQIVECPDMSGQERTFGLREARMSGHVRTKHR